MMRAMQKEIKHLRLPTTLSCVCLALRASDAVLAAHVHADCSRHNYNENEIEGISLSPTQKLNKQRDNFRVLFQLLVSRGKDVTLNSWTEVKRELSEVCNFARVGNEKMFTLISNNAIPTEIEMAKL